MGDIGFVSLDNEGKWIGGRYYLQHLIRSVAALPEAERPGMADVWWQQAPEEDPFAEVRSMMTERRIIRLPEGVFGRAYRKIRRQTRGWNDAHDLFLDAGIDVLFPIAPCENPGIPLIFWLADFQYLHLPELFSEELLTWYLQFNRQNVERAAAVVVSSSMAMHDFERVFPEYRSKAHLLRFCSVPDEEWWSLDPESVAREKGLPERFLILSNQFSHHKNHETAFEAVRILRDRGVEVTVVCTGSTWGFRGTDYFDRLTLFIAEHALEDRIRILGMLPRADQMALTRRAIAVLQPSRFEGWSTVIEDGKSLGKRIVASDIEVHREQLETLPDSQLLPQSDPDSWAATIESIWKTSEPGPDIARETKATAALVARRLECGSTFASVARGVTR